VKTFLGKWGALMVLSLALAIIIIDSTLLNVSLSTLIRDLNTTLQKLQWVISAYSLMLAALTVTGGRMGDLFGRKRMFMTGAVIFVVGAFIASISHSFGVLLLGDSIVEGIGAALMMPSTAALLVAKYRGHDRAMAFGIWGGVAAAASAIGPILGGFLTTHYSWRWGFRINIAVVAVLLAGSRLVDDVQEEREKRSTGSASSSPPWRSSSSSSALSSRRATAGCARASRFRSGSPARSPSRRSRCSSAS